jgi:hypothetical protein
MMMVRFRAWIGQARALGRRVLTARLSRISFLAEIACYVAAIAVLLIPLSTYLWTTGQIAQQLFGVAAVLISLLSFCGLVYAYVRRLNDGGIPSLWALPILILPPVGLIWAASAYGNAETLKALEDHRVPAASTVDYMNVAAVLALLVILIPTIRRPAPNPPPVQKPTFALGLASVSAATVGVLSIYAGFLQDGLWVGREPFSYYSGSAPFTLGGDSVIASCGNAKGVSAVNQQDEPGDGKFTRDAVDGVWNLLLRPDGTWDLQTNGPKRQVSYRDDGFMVSVKGIRLEPYLGTYQLPADLDRFFLVADSIGDGRLDRSANVTTIVFTKMASGWRATITSSSSMSKDAIVFGDGSHPRSSSYLLVADCRVSQAFKP